MRALMKRIEMLLYSLGTAALLSILYKADDSPSLRLWCVLIPGLLCLAGGGIAFFQKELAACWCYAAACAAFGFGLLQNSTVAEGLRTASLWRIAPLGMLLSAAVLPLFMVTRNVFLRAMLSGLAGATTILFLMPSISFMILCMQQMGNATLMTYRAAALQGGALLGLLAIQATEHPPAPLSKSENEQEESE